jgi:glutathione synthase
MANARTQPAALTDRRPEARRPSGPGPGPRILWLTDPWATLDVPHDTSLRLAERSAELAEAWWAPATSIQVTNDGAAVSGCRVEEVRRRRGRLTETLPLEGFTHIVFRVDPPVDGTYLELLRLTSAGGHGRRILNPPHVLASFAERWATGFSDLYPRSIATSHLPAFLEFCASAGDVLLKTMADCNGRRIRVLEGQGKARRRAAFLAATRGGRRPILAQQLVRGEECRAWFVNGRAVATLARRRAGGLERFGSSRRDVLHEGWKPEQAGALVAEVGRRLAAAHVWFAAADIVGGRLVDLNVTSPGLVREAEAAGGVDLAATVVRGIFEGARPALALAPRPRVSARSR